MTDALRAAYLATRILVTNHGREIDLDEVPEGGLADAVAPLEPPICIVTAWNPMSVPQPLDVNLAANLLLQAALEARPLPWLPAEGRSPDGSWREPGFAIDHISEADAREIGHWWAQVAVFYLTEGEVAILDSAGAFRDSRARSQ